MTEPITSPRTPPHAGLVLADRYELAHLIASGGMAEVWSATDLVLQRRVAVKVLHPHLAADAAVRERFRGEAVAAARLRHPSIVAIFDTCHAEGVEAIVMELVQGRTLRTYMDERGLLDVDEVVQIGVDVADALGAAHRAGIVHRDVKPANILLCDDGRVMVTDFGIAKVRDATDLTSTGTMLGTVKYLAPEQVDGQPVDARSDVYGLGVVLYEALCGEPPFLAENAAATALARLHRDAPAVADRRPDCPPALAAVVARALARRPDDRFSSASDLRTALLAPRVVPLGPDVDATVAAARPVADTAPRSGPDHTALAAAPNEQDVPHSPPVRPATGRHWGVPVTLALVVVASLALAAVLIMRTQAGEDLLAGVGDRSATNPAALPVAVTSFDPEGDGTEYDELVDLTIDGDPGTAWRTETYQSPDFGNLKPGVGLVLTLDGPARLDRLTVASASADWAAEVYVSQGAPTDLAGWGEPVATNPSIKGGTAFDLQGARANRVLLWITRLDGSRVEVNDLDLTGTPVGTGGG